MQLFVRMPSGLCATLNVDPEALIESVQAQIHQTLGVRPAFQRLTFRDKPLEVKRSLAEYGLRGSSLSIPAFGHMAEVMRANRTIQLDFEAPCCPQTSRPDFHSLTASLMTVEKEAGNAISDDSTVCESVSTWDGAESVSSSSFSKETGSSIEANYGEELEGPSVALSLFERPQECASGPTSSKAVYSQSATGSSRTSSTAIYGDPSSVSTLRIKSYVRSSQAIYAIGRATQESTSTRGRSSA